jgi:MoxR-like ATPase
MSQELSEINALIEQKSEFVDRVFNEMSKMIVGQRYVVERLLIGVLTGGHLLLEGVPGLAKTLAIKTLSDVCSVQFNRIQFTPDLLPADLIGTMMYDQVKQQFFPKKGPIFSNFVLADEINRAPAKVQSALLEAMQEKQVTLGEETFFLDKPFLVLATQNPVDQEGTYSLPEAQIDRFLMKIHVDYPKKSEEREVMDRMTSSITPVVNQVISTAEILSAQDVVKKIYIDDKIKDYILDIIQATRNPGDYGLKDLEDYIAYGASPRASIALIQCARAHAFIKRRGYVTPEDVKAVGKDVLRHRVIPTFEAEADETNSEAIISRIFSEIEVP